MPRHTVAAATNRRPTNVTLPEPLLSAARALGINVSQACEQGLASAVAEQRSAQWLKENTPAIEAWNDHVEKHGLPLGRFRQF